MALPGAMDCLLFTPADSLHMTVFEGTIDTRRATDAWPSGLSLDSTVDETTSFINQALDTFVAPERFEREDKKLPESTDTWF